MDDDYDDEFDEEVEDFDGAGELDDFNESDESDDEIETDDEYGLNDLEELGTLDGQQDAISGSFYTGYGMSVDDLDELSDEERDAYESGYHMGFGAGGGWENE